MKVLVTGSAGFIGSHVVDKLIEEKCNVVGIDNFLNGKRENVNPESTFMEASIVSIDACRAACDGVDVVLHHAAVGSVPQSIRDPHKTFLNNVCGTHNILMAALEKNVSRVVIVSSASFYGNVGGEKTKFESLGASPENPYACSKVFCDYYGRVFDKVFERLEVCIFRYFNVFGPRQKENDYYSAVIPKFIHKMSNGEKFYVHGDGMQSRDFTYVDNVVHANVLAAMAPKGKLSGKAFNICCGQKMTLNAVVKSINTSLGINAKPEYMEPRIGDIKHSHGSYLEAQRVFGYQPVVDFDDGIQRTVEWYTKK